MTCRVHCLVDDELASRIARMDCIIVLNKRAREQKTSDHVRFKKDCDV